MSARKGLLLALALWGGVSGSAWADTLTVAVAGVRGEQGAIRVAVCTEQEFLKPRCALVVSADASPGTVTVVLPDVTPGVYAVQAYHDVNGNKTIDRSFLGIPNEGVGFSNGAPMVFGPPSFADAAVRVEGGSAATIVPLTYF